MNWLLPGFGNWPLHHHELPRSPIFLRLFYVLIRSLLATGITYSAKTFDVFYCYVSSEECRTGGSRQWVGKAADTKARAGSDTSPEDSKRESMWWRAQSIVHPAQAAGPIFTGTGEQLWERQNNLQVTKHLPEGNLIKMDETLTVSNNGRKNVELYRRLHDKKKMVWHL